MSQFNAFCKAAEYANSVEQAQMISAVATGAQAAGKDIKKAIDGLLNGSG